ncbi:hypothetical protein P691DRAFT_798945 [Macrolepiota fuliginosa MF-IS2]|uniref:Conserved oligomeric Golgi complex subunit 7 n=1 Tax=Macrolepiota fuliginosa MF-IS2 TaxID=1400762 RepID=A0A9P5XP88_9AGAR|nr:hypothetical protein P691DRAFT_798945 [Macrolepiota fuliginosa MF-IS2]
MDAGIPKLLESHFGPESDPIDISQFVQRAGEERNAAVEALERQWAALSEEKKTGLANECRQDTHAYVKSALQHTWNNPSLSSFLLKEHERMTVMLSPRQSKSGRSVRRAHFPPPDTLPPEVGVLHKSLNDIKLSSWTPCYVSRLSQHAFLSSQTLHDLCKAIPCTPYAAKIAKLVDHLEATSKPTVSVQKAPKSLSETVLSSLCFRINEPYWMLHRGNCEHFIVIEQIRALHPSDPRSGYPLTLHQTPQILDISDAIISFVMSTSTTQVVDSIEQYDDVVSWINDTILFPDDIDDLSAANLIQLDQQITQLLTNLDIASEDSSTQLEHIIGDVSRGIPRLAYDLHFMKDGALALQSNLTDVLHETRVSVPPATDTVLQHLHDLDLIKSRMESAREVLREAESWSTLELEVTSLIAEKNYAKAAERLSEASKSMVVFQNTAEYDPRRNLMVNLQNQLEASLSSALVSAINAQDVANCKAYFTIFSVIQRESEFRNYYYAARRSSVVGLWQSARLSDCDELAIDQELRQQFTEFLSKFYNSFSSVLNLERTPICSIFPDPHATLSSFIASTLSALQPTYPQRLSSLVSKKNESSLTDLITALRLTEDFAVSIDKIMEKVKFAMSAPLPRRPSNADTHTHVRRRSSRMSISWRPGQIRSVSGSSGAIPVLSQALEVMEWEQELFQPFLDFQIDYGSLEKRFLEHSLAEIATSDTREMGEIDRPRLLRERAVDIFGLAEGSMGRCNAFTHGYGAVGLVWALDSFFKSFMELWTTNLQTEMSQSTSTGRTPVGDEDLADMDYTAHDWSNIQLYLHFLSSARTVSERLSGFETKLRSYLVQTASQFSIARNDPINFSIGPARGENQLLEQSTLNSTELQTLLESVENDPMHNRSGQYPQQLLEPLLVNARRSLSLFAQTCQATLQKTILSPLRRHLGAYSSLTMWSGDGDARSRSSTDGYELKVPAFSLPPSETMQKVAEGLLNLPRLFEVYADDDALSFSLPTLPHLDFEMLKGFTEPLAPEGVPAPTGGHVRRASMSFATKTSVVDPEAVSSAWLISLGHTFLDYIIREVLPTISSLSLAGGAQLASDLEYLTNIALEKWRLCVEMDGEDIKKKLKEKENTDLILVEVARLRGLGTYT